jgi:hypothetical protein
VAFQNSILAGEELVRTGMRSANYVAGVSGWRVARNGDVEFNDGVFRGDLLVGNATDGFVHIYNDPVLGPIVDFIDQGGEIWRWRANEVGTAHNYVLGSTHALGPALGFGFDEILGQSLATLVTQRLFINGGQDILAAWASWPVSAWQAGLRASTINHATYWRVGKKVSARFNLTMTAAGVAANLVLVACPFTPAFAAAGHVTPIGSGYVYSAATGIIRQGTWLASVGLGVGFGILQIDNNNSQFGIAPNYALAVGDVIAGVLDYETD